MQGNNSNHPQAPKGARLAFGIFMILIYIGVGIMFFMDVFMIDNQTVNIIIGSILCLYGVFRAYRLYKGSN